MLIIDAWVEYIMYIWNVYMEIPCEQEPFIRCSLMLGQRRRRLTSIKPILGQCILLAGQEVLSTMAWQTAMSTILQT